jgi:hypothetical protein
MGAARSRIAARGGRVGASAACRTRWGGSIARSGAPPFAFCSKPPPCAMSSQCRRSYCGVGRGRAWRRARQLSPGRYRSRGRGRAAVCRFPGARPSAAGWGRRRGRRSAPPQALPGWHAMVTWHAHAHHHTHVAGGAGTRFSILTVHFDCSLGPSGAGCGCRHGLVQRPCARAAVHRAVQRHGVHTRRFVALAAPGVTSSTGRSGRLNRRRPPGRLGRTVSLASHSPWAGFLNGV